MKKLVSIIIPVYQNEGSICLTFQKINELFESDPTLNSYDHEFVFVNDGSTDGSENELADLYRSNSSIVSVIQFSKNFGQVPALVAGYRQARGKLCISMSADLQDPPELISQMIAEWEQGNKIVIAFRQSRDDDFVSSFTSKIFYGLMNASLGNMPKGGFDFVLMDRAAVDVFNKIDERNRFFQGDILWLGFAIKYLPYERKRREIGVSQWSLKKKIKYFIDGLLNTSYLPIRLMSLMGVLCALLGAIYVIVIVVNRIFNNTPYDGWAPIMVALLLIGGCIMTMLGVIGEYIWRIYDEVRQRQYFVIDNEKSSYVEETNN